MNIDNSTKGPLMKTPPTVSPIEAVIRALVREQDRANRNSGTDLAIVLALTLTTLVIFGSTGNAIGVLVGAVAMFRALRLIARQRRVIRCQHAIEAVRGLPEPSCAHGWAFLRDDVMRRVPRDLRNVALVPLMLDLRVPIGVKQAP